MSAVTDTSHGMGHNMPPVTNPDAQLSRLFGWATLGTLAATAVAIVGARNGVGMETGRAGALGVAYGGTLMTMSLAGMTYLTSGRACAPT